MLLLENDIHANIGVFFSLIALSSCLGSLDFPPTLTLLIEK